MIHLRPGEEAKLYLGVDDNFFSGFGVTALALDLDGILVDSTPAVERHWTEFAARVGVAPGHVLEVAHGRGSREVIAEFTSDVDSQLAWFETLEAADTADVVALPGARELLESLPRERWAIVTSGGRAVAGARIAAAGLFLPALLITADDVPRAKPDPAGYRAAVERLGFAGPVLAIEDSPAGVAAALRANCVVIGVQTTHTSNELGAAQGTISSLADLKVTVRGDGMLVLDAQLLR